jgi:type VI secretion system secreted protein VgrG
VRPEEEHVSSWSFARELRSGKYALSSYDFEKPSVDLQVKSTIPREHALADYEVFEYGGDYVERGDGETYVRARIEEEQAKFERVQGATNGRAMAPGFLFTLGLHPRADQNAEYLIVSATYDIKSGEHEARDDAGSSYECTFAALNTKYPFRAERLTEKPIVKGPQTALVAGPSGDDIYTDKFGRIKVHFYWDRYGKRDDQSSCWIRVSQNWGGKGWGGMFIPHVGQEVIVMFEGGDPDLPLITGRVYNAENMPPLELPANKTQNILRDHGANEIKMQGEGGKQSIRMFSPYGETVFKLGAVNDDHEGFVMKTAKDFWGVIKGPVTWFFGNDWVTQTDGQYQWQIKGSAREVFYGMKFEFVGGIKTDTVVGLETKITLGGIGEFILAGKKEFDPIGDKKAEAQKTELVGKFDEKIGKVRQDLGIVHENIVNLNKACGTEFKKVRGQMQEQIGSYVQTVSGGVTYRLGSLDETVSGGLTSRAQVIKLESKGSTIVDASGDLYLKAKSTMFVNASNVKIRGGTIDIKNGALKIS